MMKSQNGGGGSCKNVRKYKKTTNSPDKHGFMLSFTGVSGKSETSQLAKGV